MSSIEQAREYERRYHKELYENHDLFEPGTWLFKPAAYALRSFELIPDHVGVRALDLGSGVGRHSIPFVKRFGDTSEVVCVDLIDTAISGLLVSAEKQEVDGNITGIVGDIETFDLSGESYDLILSISCIEHIPTKSRLEDFIKKLQEATADDGVHCFMIITDNEWVDSEDSKELTPLIEQNLSSVETIVMLEDLYSEWHIHDLSTKAWAATQPIAGRDVVLKSTCVQFTAQK